jgi:serine protease
VHRTANRADPSPENAHLAAATAAACFQGNPLNVQLRPALCAAAVVIACGIAAYLPVSAAAPTPAPFQRAAPAPANTDRFIVSFREDAPERRSDVARQRLLDNVGRKLGFKVNHGRKLGNGADLLRTARALDRADTKRLLNELRKDPRVAYVEIDAVHRPMFSPNDPLFPEQTYLMQEPGGVGLDRAWDRGRGEGVVVAVLDTGITAHPDLDGNVLYGGHDFISDPLSANDGDGRDHDPSDPGDWYEGYCDGNWTYRYYSSWHGTAVAGVIAAQADNATGIAGAAPNAKILPVRVLGRCGGYTSDIADAIVWSAGGTVAGVAPNPHPAEVINASFSAAGACGPTMQAAVDAANAAGAVVVASAGEQEQQTDLLSPASCNGVIAVGSGREMVRDYFSASGTMIDVLGPGGYLPLTPEDVGSWIQVTSNTGDFGPIGPEYTTQGGSSLAAAVASGTVAIMQGLRPQSPAVVASVLRQTAVDERDLACSGAPANCSAMFDADAATRAVLTPTLVIDEWRYVAEGGSGTTAIVPVTLTLTEPVSTPVTFKLATVDGTATAGVDYVAMAPTPFTILAGQTSRTVNFTVIGDGVTEPDAETFDIVLSNVAGAAPLARTARVHIGGDDGQWLSPTDSEAVGFLEEEGNKLLEFVAPEGATNVTVTISGGTGGDADLYVRKGTRPTLDMYDCADTGIGRTETCALGAVSGRHYVWVTTPTSWSGSVTAKVSWNLPTQVSISDAEVIESPYNWSYMTFVVTRTPVTDAQVKFDYNVADGTATFGQDYIGYSDDGYTIPAGQASRLITIQVSGDMDIEPNETLTVSLANVVGAEVVKGVGTGTILNDDSPSLGVFHMHLEEGNSGAKNAVVTVGLTGPMPTPVTFDVGTVAGGTATAGSDYVAKTSTAQTIPAGQTSKTFSFVVAGDTATEADETVFVELSNANVPLQHARGVVTIDNDDGPALSINDVTVAEGNAKTRVATFTVQLAQAIPYPVEFDVRTLAGTAAPGSDYLEQVTHVTVPAGMSAYAFPVAIVGDLNYESAETFQVQLSNPVNAVLGDATGIGTITNDDQAALSIADLKVTEGSTGAKSAVFTVSLGAPAIAPVGFDIATTGAGTATAGVDYTPRSLTGLQIPVGIASRTFVVTMDGDTTPEQNETFAIAIANPVNGRIADGTALATIVNDDDVPALSIGDVTLVEGQSGPTRLAVFTATLSKASAATVSFTVATTGAGSATAHDDYGVLAPTTVTIAPGQLSRTFSVNVYPDTRVERTETFVVSASGVTAATVADGSAMATIVTDDMPSLSIADVEVDEATDTWPATFTVTMSHPSPFPVSFRAATTGAGTATSGDDYVPYNQVLTIPPGETSKTFDVTINGGIVQEYDETFVVALTNAVDANIADGTALGRITDYNDRPALRFQTWGPSRLESAIPNRMVFTVELSKPSTVPVTFSVYTQDYTAVAGQDYVERVLNNLVIQPGDTYRQFAVDILDDAEDEADTEYFYVYMHGVTNANAGGSDLYTVGQVGDDE